MMGERTVMQEALFYCFSIEDRVPTDRQGRGADDDGDDAARAGAARRDLLGVLPRRDAIEYRSRWRDAAS